MIKTTRIILLALFFTFTFALFSVEIKDPDFWWHLKTGEHIVQTGAIPEIDPFAYTSTPKDPLSPESVRIKFILAQYWLAQVLFYKIYSAFDFQGIIFLRALILTLLVFLAYWSVRREGMGFYSSLALTIPVVLILHSFTGERPQLFSFLFSFLIVLLTEGFRKNAMELLELKHAATKKFFLSTVYYLLPTVFIMLLWANMHGGYIVGIAILLCYLAAEWMKYFFKKLGSPLPAVQLKQFSGVVVISILVTLVNPNTYKVIPFLVELEGGLYKSFIVETMSPVVLFRSGFYETQFFIFFALLFVTALLFLLRLRTLDLTDIIIVTMLAAASLSISRFIPYFAPVAILMIARYSHEFIQRLPKVLETIRRNIVIPVNSFFIIVIILMLINGDMFKKGVRPNKYPEGAAKFLKENRLQGNMFNPYVWGGYLLWSLYPDYKVFIDGRGLIPEVFFQGVKVLEASAHPVRNLPEWKAMLNAYNVKFIVTFSVGTFTGRLVPLIPALLNDPEWHLVYMDNISLIFVKDSAENREIISRYGIPKEWLWNEVAVEAALKAKDAPNKANYYETMGDAFLSKRNYYEAREAYIKALELKPGDTRLINRVEQLNSIMRTQGQ